MVLGMSVVIVFLVVLVLCMRLMAAIVQRFTPITATELGTVGSAAGATGGPQGGTDELHKRVAAVVAAVALHHRRRHPSTASKGEQR